MTSERIELRPFRLNRQEYLEILLRVIWKKRGWLYAPMVILGLVFLFASNGRVFIMVAGIVNLTYPLVIIISCVNLTRKKANQSVYEERSVAIDSEGMSIGMSGGAASTVPWAYVTDVVELNTHTLLYLSANSFVFINRAAFPDANSEVLFKQWLERGRKR
ncbi:MAG: YcxB family protein [Flavobacteriales bacterium]